MKVVVADENAQVRWALRAFLREELSSAVVGEARDTDSLLATAAATRPDLVLLEWELPGGTGPSILEALRRLEPCALTLVLGQYPEYRLPALAAGADSFVCKTSSPEQIRLALRALLGR